MTGKSAEEMFTDILELQEAEIIIVACQPEEVSSPYVEYGLSDSVQKALPKAIDMVYDILEGKL